MRLFTLNPCRLWAHLATSLLEVYTLLPLELIYWVEQIPSLDYTLVIVRITVALYPGWAPQS
jgi:hypothetical protein